MFTNLSQIYSNHCFNFFIGNYFQSLDDVLDKLLMQFNIQNSLNFYFYKFLTQNISFRNMNLKINLENAF